MPQEQFHTNSLAGKQIQPVSDQLRDRKGTGNQHRGRQHRQDIAGRVNRTKQQAKHPLKGN